MTTDAPFSTPIASTARATAFLSRLPVPDRFFQGSHDGIAGDAVWFPIAGLIIIVPSLVLLCVLILFDVPSLLAAVLLVLAGIGVTGALHEDGLADVADGFWGGKTREDVLHIMRDSRIGTYGAVGIGGSMLVRVAALAAIFETVGPVGVAAALLAQAMIARAAMVWLWSSLPPARTDGLSRASGQPAENQGWIALSMAAVLILPLLAIWSIGPFILALAFCALTLWFFRRLVKARIAGHTGDTLGACEQLISAAFLTALASAA